MVRYVTVTTPNSTTRSVLFLLYLLERFAKKEYNVSFINERHDHVYSYIRCYGTTARQDSFLGFEFMCLNLFNTRRVFPDRHMFSDALINVLIVCVWWRLSGVPDFISSARVCFKIFTTVPVRKHKISIFYSVKNRSREEKPLSSLRFVGAVYQTPPSRGGVMIPPSASVLLCTIL